MAPRAPLAGGASAPESARRTAVRVLAIETSCDETAAAVVEDGYRVLSSVVSSQTDIHATFGGVVPEIASRAHLELLGPVVTEAMARASTGPDELTAVAATIGPGLGRLVAGRGERGQGLRLVVGHPVRGCEPHGRPSPRRFPGRPHDFVADRRAAGFGRPYHAHLHAVARRCHRRTTARARRAPASLWNTGCLARHWTMRRVRHSTKWLVFLAWGTRAAR